jgi:hypothetical protein
VRISFIHVFVSMGMGSNKDIDDRTKSRVDQVSLGFAGSSTLSFCHVSFRW